jgi:hypothetical protein
MLSADSVIPNAAGTQGYNLYGYAANNPTTWTDPSGHVATSSITLNLTIALIVLLMVMKYGAPAAVAFVGETGATNKVGGVGAWDAAAFLVAALSVFCLLYCEAWFSQGSSPVIGNQPDCTAYGNVQTAVEQCPQGPEVSAPAPGASVVEGAIPNAWKLENLEKAVVAALAAAGVTASARRIRDGMRIYRVWGGHIRP